MNPAKPRKRMSVDERREQMLDAGAEVFATRGPDEISIDDLIAAAGVSRALFYHYFPGKREFFIEAIRRATARIQVATEPDPSLPPIERLRASIDGYFDVVSTNPLQYRAVFQSSISSDAELRAVMGEGLAMQEQRILDAVAPLGGSPEMQRVAVRGWLSFLVACCLDWLETESPPRDRLRDLCVDTLIGALASAARPE
ncbi:MAG: TetR/AcrR family transcriptional regulator [Actinobacteria bacterium]|nr:TetR/AcrR family transcriptional regulator [Actinomycetota bacterium]